MVCNKDKIYPNNKESKLDKEIKKPSPVFYAILLNKSAEESLREMTGDTIHS